MAAEKTKTRRRSYRRRSSKKITTLTRLTRPHILNIKEKPPREIKGEHSLCRTRAQTARRTVKAVASNTTEGELSLFTGVRTRTPVHKDTGELEGQQALSPEQAFSKDATLYTPLTTVSDSPTEEPEEEKEEFFMAPEGTEKADSPSLTNVHFLNSELVTDKTDPTTFDQQILPNVSTSENHALDIQYETKKAGKEVDISSMLAAINAKLLKLDTLEYQSRKLEGNLSSVQSKVNEVSNSINSVKQDMSRHVSRWEETVKGIADRVAELEKGAQSWEKRWEQQREALSGDCKVLQSSIDSNSKQIIELETILSNSKQKWESLNKLEEKIKEAAENKFKDVQKLLRDVLHEELLEEMKTVKSHGIPEEQLKGLREEMTEKMQIQKEEVINL